MSRHQRWVESALRLSNKSTFPTYKMCSLLVKSNRLISIGFNKDVSGESKDSRYLKKGIHAELSCLIGIDYEDTRGAELYVAGKSKAGNIILSKPCAICTEMLRSLPLKGVYYHTKTGQVNEYIIQ